MVFTRTLGAREIRLLTLTCEVTEIETFKTLNDLDRVFFVYGVGFYLHPHNFDPFRE